MMTTETRRWGEGILFLVLFALTIPLANWMIGHAGTVCPPHGPCLVPVAPGLMAPSGVAGLIVDSIVFLWLAFGSLDFLSGQVVGKAWMVLLSIPLVAWLRRRDERIGIMPA